MVEKRVFSLYDIEQFIREAGAERVTEDAVRDLEKEIERLANSIAKKSIRYAEHAGRTKLIRTSDVLLTKAMSHQETLYSTPNHLSSSATTTNPTSKKVR